MNKDDKLPYRRIEGIDIKKFVKLIRNEPALYDREHPSYLKRDVKEEIWKRIAKYVGDTPSNCKERWKNLRTAYTRNLRTKSRCKVKNKTRPYYLFDEMQFLLSHLKHCLVKGGGYELEARNHEENSAGGGEPPGDGERCEKEAAAAAADDDDNVSTRNYPATYENVDVTSEDSSTARRAEEEDPLEKDEEETADFGKSGRGPPFRPPPSTEGDLHFLKSLLPDMALMSRKQKHSFKVLILEAVEKVIEGGEIFVKTEAEEIDC